MLILRKGFPNNPNVNASRIVDFPDPFSPIIKVVGDLSKKTVVGVSPVERKFFQEICLNTIININYFRLRVVGWLSLMYYLQYLIPFSM